MPFVPQKFRARFHQALPSGRLAITSLARCPPQNLNLQNPMQTARGTSSPTNSITMAIKERSGIAVGLKRGHVSIISSPLAPQHSRHPCSHIITFITIEKDRKTTLHSGPSWLTGEVRKLENRRPRVETTYFTYQRSFGQAYGFREGDCQRGCGVGISCILSPCRIPICLGLILLLSVRPFILNPNLRQTCDRETEIQSWADTANPLEGSH